MSNIPVIALDEPLQTIGKRRYAKYHEALHLVHSGDRGVCVIIIDEESYRLKLFEDGGEAREAANDDLLASRSSSSSTLSTGSLVSTPSKLSESGTLSSDSSPFGNSRSPSSVSLSPAASWATLRVSSNPDFHSASPSPLDGSEDTTPQPLSSLDVLFCDTDSSTQENAQPSNICPITAITPLASTPRSSSALSTSGSDDGPSSRIDFTPHAPRGKDATSPLENVETASAANGSRRYTRQVPNVEEDSQSSSEEDISSLSTDGSNDRLSFQGTPPLVPSRTPSNSSTMTNHSLSEHYG